MKLVAFSDETFSEFIKAKATQMKITGENLTHDGFLKLLLKRNNNGR